MLVFFVVAVDARGHGRRENQYNFIDLLDSINETANDISMIIDFYQDKKYINNESIGIMGYSMGGLISFREAIIDARIKSVSSVNSSFDWNIHPLNPVILDKMSITNNIDKIFDYEKQFNPVYKIYKLFSTPVLMINGKKMNQ